MGMTDGDYSMAAIKVEVFDTFVVPHPATLALDDIDIEKASEFINMSATLLEIKSRQYERCITFKFNSLARLNSGLSSLIALDITTV
jgi:hypothetical protein